MSASLHATKNYGLFELCDFNRSVDERRLKPLIESMKVHGYIPAYPLHVVRNGNGKLKIKAGHHRFEAAMRLGLSVYYVICEDTATIHGLETAGPGRWSAIAFMQSYVKLGNTSYVALKEYMDRTGIGLTQAASMLAGETATSGNQIKRVSNGTFVVGDTTHSETVARLVCGFRNLGVQFAANNNFVGALSRACRVTAFDPETFLHKAAMNPAMIVKQATVDQFMELIERVYNYCAKQKVPLAFLAREAAKARQPAAFKGAKQ